MALRGLLTRLTSAAAPVAALGGLGAVGYGAYTSIYQVDAGHKAIMYSRLTGLGNDTVAEGYHFRIPWFQRPVIFETRTRQREFRGQRTGTKDLQTVTMDLRVLYSVDANKLQKVYREVGGSVDEPGGAAFDNMILPSVVVESLKGVVASFDADKLVTEREAVSRLIKSTLSARAKTFGIKIDDIAITQFHFSRMYEQAVERKQIAQQNAQRAQFYVLKAEQEKQQKIVEAEGEEQSARLVGAMIKDNPAYLNLEKIKAAKEIATIVAQSQNRVYLNSSSLLLDVNNALISAADLKGANAATGW